MFEEGEVGSEEREILIRSREEEREGGIRVEVLEKVKKALNLPLRLCEKYLPFSSESSPPTCCLHKMESIQSFLQSIYTQITHFSNTASPYLRKAKSQIILLLEKTSRIMGIYKLATMYRPDSYVGRLNYFHIISKAWLNIEFQSRINENYEKEKISEVEELKLEAGYLLKLAEMTYTKEFVTYTQLFHQQIVDLWPDVVHKIQNKTETLQYVGEVLRKTVSKCMNFLVQEELSLAFYDVFEKVDTELGDQISLNHYLLALKAYLGIIWKDKFPEVGEMYFQFAIVDMFCLTPEVLVTYAEDKSFSVALRNSGKNIAYKLADLGFLVYKNILESIYTESDRKYHLEQDPNFRELEEFEGRLERLAFYNTKTKAAIYYRWDKSLDYLTNNRPYAWINKYMKFEEKYQFVRESAVSTKQVLEDYILKMKDNMILVFHTGMKSYSVFLSNIKAQDLDKLWNILKTKYSGFVGYTKGCWLRLDFDKSGDVSVEDVRQQTLVLWKYLRDYRYFDEGRQMLGGVYAKAITYIKAINTPDKPKIE